MKYNVIKPDYQTLIYEFRGHKVMMDWCGNKTVEGAGKTKRTRFPEDFMFELNKDEFERLRSQIATSTN